MNCTSPLTTVVAKYFRWISCSFGLVNIAAILIRTNVQSHQHQSLMIGALHWCRCAWQVMRSYEQVYSAVHEPVQLSAFGVTDCPYCLVTSIMMRCSLSGIREITQLSDGVRTNFGLFPEESY
jgi:hypothetical protein